MFVSRLFRSGGNILGCPQRPRHRQAKAGAAAKLGRHADVAAEVAEGGQHIGEANAVARPVLRARALEQIEHAFPITFRDAAAVVSDFDLDAVVRNRARLYLDVQRPIHRAILDGVVEQVADDELQRETVALDRGYIQIDIDLPVGLGQLMLDRGGAAGDDLPEVDGLAFSGRRPSRASLRTALISRSIFSVEERM